MPNTLSAALATALGCQSGASIVGERSEPTVDEQALFLEAIRKSATRADFIVARRASLANVGFAQASA